MSLFNQTQQKTYFLVKEGRNGIETFMDKDIDKFNPAYKDMLIAFLERSVNILKGNKNGQEPNRFQ